MKKIRHSFKLQGGVASLLTAVMLLISITLVVLFTSKTVLMETKMVADDYRTSQATAAAQAAMEKGVAYFMAGGMDQFVNNTTTPFAVTTTAGSDGSVVYNIDYSSTSPLQITLTSGTDQETKAQFYFDNTEGNRCHAPADYPNDKGEIIATGWSDDGEAERTVSQCVGVFDILNAGKGPSQPMVSHGSTGVSGNIMLVNRYTQSNIWSGGSVDAANAAFGTWVAPIGGVTSGGLNDSCSAAGCDPDSAVASSNWKGGIGSDVIDNDATLANLTADEMFALFFGSNTRANVRAIANSSEQTYASADDVPADTTGLIYTDTGGTLPNVGTAASPAILVVNGDVTMGTTFYGIVYATGTITMKGSKVVYGSAISESLGFDGSGNPQIVYVPMGGNKKIQTNPFIGTMAVIAGTWKDW